MSEEKLAACLGAPQEQEHKDLREALTRIAAIEDCQCGHNDENCCERVGEPCATCIAAVALRAAVLPPSPQEKKETYESQPVQPCLDQPEGSADSTSVLRADCRASTPTDEGRDGVRVPKLQGHADAQKLERLQWRHERLRDWLQTALETLDVRDFPESVREFLEADADNGVLPPSQEKEP